MIGYREKTLVHCEGLFQSRFPEPDTSIPSNMSENVKLQYSYNFQYLPTSFSLKAIDLKMRRERSKWEKQVKKINEKKSKRRNQS
mgnify:CR=1 FL=1